MAAPRGRPQSRTTTKRSIPGRVEGRGVPERRWSGRKPGKIPWYGTRFERVFVVLVVPVLLMLGSVYVHTVANRLEREGALLEEEKVRAESEGERLEVRITELSEPGRIRALAKENLRMRDPGKDLEPYGSDGGDAVDDGEEKSKGIGE